MNKLKESTMVYVFWISQVNLDNWKDTVLHISIRMSLKVKWEDKEEKKKRPLGKRGKFDEGESGAEKGCRDP